MRIYPRGKKGTLWVDVEVDDERIRRSTGTTDQRQASEYAARLASDLWRAKRLGETPQVIWDHAVVEWLKENGHLRTVEEIKARLRWLTVHLRGKSLPSIDGASIRRIISSRKAEVINKRAVETATKAGKIPPIAQLTSNATVNRHLAELSRVLVYAHSREWLAAVPPIPKMHEPRSRVKWITREEAATLIAELPDHLAVMARFALATGLRESNIRLLCWQQIDITRRVAWIYADQAKAKKDLSIPLNDDAMAVLATQQAKNKRWVFPVPKIVPMAERRRPDETIRSDSPTGKISNHAWRKACIRAGHPTLRFHDLRHTWASWHVQAGTPLPVLQELGGWASLTMVQRYAHLAVSHVAAWAGNVDRGTNRSQVPMTAQTNAAPDLSEAASVLGYSRGWLMGLEPTTTGITILDSTN